jgi:uncharacterized protein
MTSKSTEGATVMSTAPGASAWYSKLAETGELLIDVDVHEELPDHAALLPYLDPHWQRYIKGEGGVWRGVESGGMYAMPLPPRSSREEWLLENGTQRGTSVDALRGHLFEGEGVSLAIMNGLFHVSANDRDYEFMTALASAYNDWQIKEWLEPEPRLRGSVHVVSHDPIAAAREIDRVAEHPQIVQVFLPTVTNRQYGDRFYWPIYEAALRHDLALTLHHGIETQTVLGRPRYYIEWHTVAAPQANMNQLLSLVCNGVFDEFPDLRVVLLECGVAWLPWFMWRLDQQYRELRTNVPWVKRLPSEHIRDCVRIATQPMNDITPKQFLQIVELSESEEMFVFATDYPHYDADSVDAVLPKTAIPDELRERIRWRNALETFPRLRSLLG